MQKDMIMIPERLRPLLTKKRLLMERARRDYEQQAVRIEQEIAALHHELARIHRPAQDAETAYYDTARATGYCVFCERTLDACHCPPPFALAGGSLANIV